MNKEKTLKLQTYASKLKDRLSAETPNKHKGHPETLKAFLNKELKTVTKQLEADKLESGAKK